MTTKFIATCCLLLLAFGGVSVQAAPESMSIEVYEAYLESMKADIEEEVNRQFAAEQAELEQLEKPLELNEKVTVRYRRGPRLLQAEGTFRDLNINSNPPYVQVGDRRIYFNDVLEIDRQRLYWGSLPEAQRGPLKVQVDRRRQQLEDRKERVRRVKRNTLLDRAGYTKEFFRDTIRLNGQFRYREKLGHQTMDLVVEIDEVNPLAKAAVINRTNDDSVITVYLAGNPISTNLPEEFGVEFPELEWNSHVFWLFKEDLGATGADAEAPVMNRISEDFRFHLMRKGAGSWWLKPSSSPATRPRANRTNRVVCPECYGATVIEVSAGGGTGTVGMPAVETGAGGATASADGDDAFAVPGAEANKTLDEQVDTIGAALDEQENAAAGNMMTCPRCLGKGYILQDDSHNITTYTYRLQLIEQNMQDYSSALAGKYTRVSQNSQDYQGKVDALISEVKTKAQEERQKNAALLRAQEEARRQKEEEARRLREKLEAVMEKYLWMTAAEAREANLPAALENFRTQNSFDNTDFPSEMRVGDQEVDIRKFTDWETPPTPVNVSDRDKGIKMFGLRYRILQGELDGNPQFYIQYVIDADTTSARNSLLLKLKVSYQIQNQNEPLVAEGIYRLPPSKLMQVLGTVEIGSQAVAEGVSDVKLGYEVE